MKKKLITSIVCFALLLIMFLGSSIAYFSDTQENVNVITAGMVSIEQGVVFDKLSNLMPGVTNDLEGGIVTVTNDGNQPCYARTIFAFEDAVFKGESGNSQEAVYFLTLSGGDGTTIIIPGVNAEGEKIQFTVTKDGKTTLFTVGYYVHSLALGANKGYTCLDAIAVKREADNAWLAAVDNYYDILVLSQACQVTGFADPADALNNPAVFGEINGNSAAKWFKYLLEHTDGYLTDGQNLIVEAYSAPTNP